MLDKIKKILGIPVKVAKDEVAEIKGLVVTEEDRDQGKKIALAVYAACAVYGIPCPKSIQDIIAMVGAYAVRDAKDGLHTPSKLIISRVIGEFQPIFSRKYHNK